MINFVPSLDPATRVNHASKGVKYCHNPKQKKKTTSTLPNSHSALVRPCINPVRRSLLQEDSPVTHFVPILIHYWANLVWYH